MLVFPIEEVSIRHRSLRNGLVLSELGLGTAAFGNLFTETSDEACDEAVAASWEGGIRYFDTAPHYGLGVRPR